MTTETAHQERLGFQAEVKQLLDLMIHSLYSNKEIFLRELISNASDAEDKLRFEAVTNPELWENDSELKITISYDKNARTITVADNGIGMSREEVIENIGTIARSGTKEFFQALTGDQRKDANLIGQFGVGFYSTFIVSDKVTLITRRAGLKPEEGVIWQSDGQGEYTIEYTEKASRGTEVTLHLREGEDDFLSGYRLRSIIRQYSDHINLPIVMPVEKSEEKEGEETPEPEFETINQAAALWTRSKNEITAEEYHEFYKHLSYDFREPLAYVHSRMEGRVEYTLLLYVPSAAPFDLFTRDKHHGVKLYVRRVFIMDDAEKLMPNYLRWVRGVIDSNDLPLNVSREILQQNKVLELVRNGATKKVLTLLEDMAKKEPDKFATVWKEFGRVLKEGVVEDSSNKETVAGLLRFASTHNSGDVQDVSLADYIERMKDGQDKIYYITADTFATASNSPLLEIFKKKGIEVLLLTDIIDNWVVTNLMEYKGKQLQSVAKGEFDLKDAEDTQEKEQQQKAADDFKAVTERMKSALADKVKEVRVTHRLNTAPACLVADEHDLDASFQRILKAAGQKMPGFKPIFEINPQHPILLKLKEELESPDFNDWSHVLFDQAVLSDGGQLEDPVTFVNKLNNLLVSLSTNR
jgi:molecular chaperone HtpG